MLQGKRLKNRRSTLGIPSPSESRAQNSSNLSGKEIDSMDNFSNITSPSFRTKRGFVAFIPALAGLVTITVESIGSFLQKKHNEALSKGLNAIKSDQPLTWNSIKQH